MGLLDELLRQLEEAAGGEPQRPVRRVPARPPEPEPEPERKAHHEIEHDTVHRLVPDSPPAPPAPPSPGSGLRQGLRDPRALRDALVLREILGPPLALRRRRGW